MTKLAGAGEERRCDLRRTASTSATTRGTSTRSTRDAGKILWKAKAQPRFGSAGNFYATPAVAYGRVYIGATDGKVYSFGASSGKLRWSQSTGRLRLLVGRGLARPRLRRLVLAHASSASTRRPATILWQFKANGPISGLADRRRGPRLLRDAGRARPTRSTRGTGARPGRSRTASTRRSSPTRTASTWSATRGSTGSTRRRAKTLRTLSATSALRALRQAGLATCGSSGRSRSRSGSASARPGTASSSSTSVTSRCFGGKVNVRWAGGVLSAGVPVGFRGALRRHRGGRLHRLASRRVAAGRRPRRRRSRLLHRLLRPGVEGGERARARRAARRSGRGRARLRRFRRLSSTSRASRACAASATSSRSTCGGTCSRRSGLRGGRRATT